MFYSPLRYPGGKNRLANFIYYICKANDINGHYIEPYAGGAAVALYLLFNKRVSQITINDIDRSIYAFWYSVLNKTQDFCKLVKKTEINIENWRHCQSIQKNKEKATLLDLGFSTFFLNRTNISGVIDAGVIGGINQGGKYKMDCRFNKKELIKRIRKIARKRENIHLYQLNALDLIDKIEKDQLKKSTIFYFDPPYYIKGESLYLNSYKHDDHKAVSDRIKEIKNARWVVSYDNNENIKSMYEGYRLKEFSLTHSARISKEGKEVMFFSNNLIVPVVSNPVNMVIK
jgi:DNA adenine methylase